MKTIQTLESKIEAPPRMTYSCGWRGLWANDESTITYESIWSDGGDGDLNKRTGKFTAPFDGAYTITYSGFAELTGPQYVRLHIAKNGVQSGGYWASHVDSDSGFHWEQGSSTEIKNLKKGDTLELRAGVGSRRTDGGKLSTDEKEQRPDGGSRASFEGNMNQLTFCVSGWAK